jgi:hypothetical protein
MAASPATPQLQQGCSTLAVPGAPAEGSGTPAGFATPGANTSGPGTAPAAPDSYFKALKKVVRLEEVDMGSLCETNGLGACLKSMAEAEINPIVTHGKQCPS